MEPAADMPVPVHVSIRWSDEDQDDSSSGERQRKACEAFAAEIDGRIVDVMIDAGVSARDGHNLRYSKLADFHRAALAGKVKTPCIAMFEEPDRLGRAAPEDIMAFVLDLIRAKVAVAFAKQKTVLRPGADNLLGLLTTLIQADGNAKENTKRIGRVVEEITQRKAALRKGYVYSAKVPQWLECPRVKGKRQFEREITPNGVRPRAVVRMFELAADGLGNISIAARLNALRGSAPEFEPWNGREWTHDVVDSVLSNPAVRGWFQPHRRLPHPTQPVTAAGKRRYVRVPEEGGPIRDYFPQVVGDDLWNRAQAARKKNARAKRGAVTRNTNLLSGLLRCGACRHTMYLSGRLKRGGAYLKCRSAAQGGCRHTQGYATVDIEDAVLTRALVDERLAGPSDFYAAATGETDRLAAEAERLRARIEEETRLYRNARRNANNADDDKDAAEFLSDMREHKRVLQEAETGLAEVERRLAASRGSDPLLAAMAMMRLVNRRSEDEARAELAPLARRLFSQVTLLDRVLTLHSAAGTATLSLAVPGVASKGGEAAPPPGDDWPPATGNWMHGAVADLPERMHDGTEAAARARRGFEELERLGFLPGKP